MTRFDSDPADSYYQPTRTLINYQASSPALDTGHQVSAPVEDSGVPQGPFYGLPPGPDKYTPSRSLVGPSASVQPRAALAPGIPAGSLFSSRGYGYTSAYRGRVPAQRSFSVEYQDKLRRRKKGWLF